MTGVVPLGSRIEVFLLIKNKPSLNVKSRKDWLKEGGGRFPGQHVIVFQRTRPFE